MEPESYAAANSRDKLHSIATRCYWLIPALIAVIVYLPGLNNYFAYDDFIWLYKAKTLSSNPLQAFQPDLYYFDPLAHLSFFSVYSFGGLEPKWFQANSILLHAVNSILVYKLSCKISNDTKSALYSSIVFASSCVVADAVLWPSSVVDLLSTLFSLATLLAFIKYFETGNCGSLWLSGLSFICALSAKGTPVVIPLILFYVGIKRAKTRRFQLTMFVYALVVGLYFALLSTQSGKANYLLHTGRFNLKNVMMSLCELFVPERILADLNLSVVSLAVIALVALFAFVRPTGDCFIALRRTGIVIFVCSVLPMAILNNFTYATVDGMTLDLLGSPSHRIYLASVGSALFCGGVLRLIETSFGQIKHKISSLLTAAALVALVAFNAGEVSRRDRLWEYSGEHSKATVAGLLAHRDRIVEGGQIALFNFNTSKGFMTAMIKVFSDVHDVTVLMNNNICFGVKEELKLLDKADKSALLVLDEQWQVHDLSDLFRLKLYNNIQANRAHDKTPFILESIRLTDTLNRNIAEITHERCVEM